MENNYKQKVSIIIPYYNTKEFISECINSVFLQSYSNIEIIIVNDDSASEDTLHLESLLTDERVKYLKNEKRRGVAYSRFKGVEAASGEYVFFLDSDDMLFPNSIELLVNQVGDSPAIFGSSKMLLRPSDIENSMNAEAVVVKYKPSNSLLEAGSILNILIKREFIADFEPNLVDGIVGFTDIITIMPFILYQKNFPSLIINTYYKRVRNDPISNPSLDQRPLIEKTRDFVKVYLEMHKTYRELVPVRKYLDQIFLNYYRRNIIPIFMDKNYFDELLSLLMDAARVLGPNEITALPGYYRRELKQLIKGNRIKFIKHLRLHVEASELKNALKGFTRMKIYIYKKVFLKQPIKDDYIIFESFLGKNYSDSPRNIYEYIQEHELDFKCIWVVNDKNRKIPGNAKVVKRFSLAYYYYFAVSKYWVNNMRQPLHLKKREGNVFLETWHGTPLKKLVFDMKDVFSANPKYKRDFYLQSRSWDFLLSPNHYSSGIFKSAFKFDKEMLEYGYPRNDILYATDKDERAIRIKEEIGIPKDKKVILYAPTWRDDDFYEPGKYKFKLQLDLNEMKEKFGDEYVVALRMHYFIADDLNVEGLNGFAFNLSKYDDIAELYLLSDILITDYSSVFFDYANLKRPILFYTYDLDKYRDQLRGFYIDFEKEAPGPLLKTSEEVINAIINIDQITKEYSSNYGAFYEKFCSWHDGKSTEKVVNRVFLHKK